MRFFNKGKVKKQGFYFHDSSVSMSRKSDTFTLGVARKRGRKAKPKHEGQLERLTYGGERSYRQR